MDVTGRSIMAKWKILDEVKILCKSCNLVMIVESTRTNTDVMQGLYVCRKCGEHINLTSTSKKEVQV